MTIAVIVRNENKAAQMVQWAAHFARALLTDLLILIPTPRTDVAEGTVDIGVEDDGTSVSPLVAAVRGSLAQLPDLTSDPGPALPTPDADADDGEPALAPRLAFLKEVRAADPIALLIKELSSTACDLLVLPRHEPGAADDADTAFARELFQRCACQTVQLRPGVCSGDVCRSILVPMAGGPHAAVSLRLAQRIAAANDGQVTALFVEPNVDVNAEAVGQRIIDRLIAAVLGKSTERVGSRVVVANSVLKGLAAIDLEPFDLVLLGASNQGVIRRMLFGTVQESFMARETAPAVAVMRDRVPLANRVRQATERMLQRTVPQLIRDERVTLVERVQSSSIWDFDFIALMCLSTTIAALGLVRDAGAVVIGAMLVAPLMTPLLGSGLALVQGNAILIRNTTRAVLFGFLLAFAIGVLTGRLTGLAEVTQEMAARGEPNLIDLAVAFVSGAAAAYATCRPNLSAALPGVAIAAALVPPIATSGLATSLGNYDLAAGAAMLFLTNIVAIVIATAFTLWAVGVRDVHEHGGVQTWTRWVRLLLILAVAGVCIGLALWQGKPPEALIRDVETSVATLAEGRLVRTRLIRERDELLLRVEIEAPRQPSGALARKLAQMADPYYDRKIRVHIITRLVTDSRITSP